MNFRPNLLDGIFIFLGGPIFKKTSAIMQPDGFYEAIEGHKFDWSLRCWMYKFVGNNMWYSEDLLKIVQANRGSFIVPPMVKTSQKSNVYDFVAFKNRKKRKI